MLPLYKSKTNTSTKKDTLSEKIQTTLEGSQNYLRKKV